MEVGKGKYYYIGGGKISMNGERFFMEGPDYHGEYEVHFDRRIDGEWVRCDTELKIEKSNDN